jgi:predicted phosphodiesterase
MAKQLSTEIVIEALKLYPNLPSLSLARKIYADNIEVFKSVEAARSSIRYQRGAVGKSQREALADKSHMTEWNKYKLPESDGEDYDPFYIDGEQKILILADVHIPYHDIEAIQVALDYAKDRDITTVLLNGDIIDFHQLSYFMKDPRKRHVKGELDALKSFLNIIRKTFPKAKIIYKIGNHEERLENYLKTKAPELLDVIDWELSNYIPQDLGIEWVSDKRIIKAGKLNILHGHELRINSINVNPARTTFLKTYESSVIGHSHRTSEHTESSLNGEIITCWSVGALCWLHPHWTPINKWNHGFATVRVDSDGYFNVKNRRIINGEVR